MGLSRALRDRKHARLLLAARAGDTAAFRDLYRDLLPPVTSYIRSRLTDPADAQELTASVFHRFLERLDRYDRRRGSVMAWLLTLAHNRLVDHVRARQPEGPLDELTERLPGGDPDPLQVVLRDEQARRVWAEIERLPTAFRRMFELRFRHDLSYREIAGCLGLTEAAVKQRFSRVLRDLRRRCQERERPEVEYAS